MNARRLNTHWEFYRDRAYAALTIFFIERATR